MDIKNVVCYSFDLFSQNCLAYLRLVGPLRQSGVNIINGIENGQTVCEKVLEGDIVIIQRNFPKKFDDYRKIVEIARQGGKPIVFDMDDLLFSLPENHPFRQTQDYVSSLLPMYQVVRDANLVTVSTKKLRDVFKCYNQNIVVLQNYFIDNLWQLKPPVIKKSKNEVLTIGFMGTSSHKPDLEYVLPVLLDLKKRFPQKIIFQFWGIEPPEEMRSFSKVTPIPRVSINNEYKDFATFFQKQSADIFIAPLVDNLFNQCKSQVKFFEYSALGVPGVYSRLEPYTQVITHGKNGLLAASLDEWSECLTQLINNDEQRFQLAMYAQATIRASWLLSQNAYRWPETFHDLRDTPLRKESATQPDIIQSINTQLVETFMKNETELQILMSRVAEKDQTIKALTEDVAEKERAMQAISGRMAKKEQAVLSLSAQVAEKEQALQGLRELLSRTTRDLIWTRTVINGYAHSTSWKMTKPIRKIKDIFLSLKK